MKTNPLWTRKAILKRVIKTFRNPYFNLAINILMLVLNVTLGVSQVLLGNFLVGSTLLFGSLGCVSGIVYWLFIALTDPACRVATLPVPEKSS